MTEGNADFHHASHRLQQEARAHDERIRVDLFRMVVAARGKNQTWPECVEATVDAYRWVTGREWGRGWGESS